MCNNGKRDLIKPVASVVLCKFRNFLLVIDSNYVTPVFKGDDLCVIIKKGPHKTHCHHGFLQILDFLLVIYSNCVAHVFQGGHLCVIIMKGPHKTHYLTGFVQNSKIVACNPFKLCGPRFPRW